MNLLLLRISLAFAGLFPLVVVLVKTRRNRRLIRTGVKAHGVVRQVLGSRHDTLNAIDIEYQTNRGMVLKRVPVAGLLYRVGQRLPLIHAIDDPQNRMLGWRSVHPVLILLAGATALFFFILAVMLDEV